MGVASCRVYVRTHMHVVCIDHCGSRNRGQKLLVGWLFFEDGTCDFKLLIN